MPGIADAGQIVAIPSNPRGIYSLGEDAAWRLHVRGSGSLHVTEIRYTLRKNGLIVIREGKLDTATLSATLNEPGTLLAELTIKTPNGENKSLAGAAFGPEKLMPAETRPVDFDGFWNAKLAELQKTPLNPSVETADSGQADVNYYKIRLDGYRGSHIYGQLAKPRRGGKFPALLIFQWAGVYPLQREWVVREAKAGWLVLNIMAHDLPIDKPQAFYDQANLTTLANYHLTGNDDREKSTFLRMYLSGYRAAEYLSRRPEWNGRTLVVMGTSQGGMLALATAGMHPKVTACLANTPAGSDLNGPKAKRAPGWPAWYWQTQGKDPESLHRTARYFDIVNFASRVKSPTLVVLGLLDVVCPPAGIFAMANQLKGPKDIVVMPQAGHGETNEMFQRHADAWLAALVKGKLPHVK